MKNKIDITTRIVGPTNHQHMIFDKDFAKEIEDNYETAKKAGDILLNRDSDMKVVNKYKNDMDNGLWSQEIDLTPILIDSKLRLRGGLHRIKAFRASTLDKIKFPVIYPAQDEEIERQDTIKNRTNVNKNTMSMTIELYNKINALENLAERNIHSAGGVLCFADNHPGYDDKGKTSLKGEAGKAYQFTSKDIDLTIEKYMPAFEAIDDDAFPDGKKKANNFACFSPYLAAFAKAYAPMQKPMWRTCVRLLTVQNIAHIDPLKDTNLYKAANKIIELFPDKEKANNPRKVEKDMFSILGCLAAAKNNVDVNTIDNLQFYGWETFIK